MHTLARLMRVAFGCFLWVAFGGGLSLAQSTIPIPVENHPPRISRYENSVSPKIGRSDDTFQFSFYYYDQDGDICARCEAWIDLDGNGAYENNEKFPLLEESTNEDMNQGRSSGMWKGSFVVTPFFPSPEIRFRFYASDGKSEATEYADAVGGGTFIVHSAVAPLGSEKPDGYFSVAGARMVITVGVLVDWMLAEDKSGRITLEDMNLDWTAVVPMGGDMLTEVSRTITKRFHNDFFDAVYATFIYDVSEMVSLGEHTVTFSPLPYVQPSKPTNAGTIPLPSVHLTILPFHISSPVISRRGVAVGDTIEYSFSILLGTEYAKNPDYLFDESTPTFPPFETVRRSAHTRTYPRGARDTQYSFTLRYFGAPGTATIPALPIFGKAQLPDVSILASSVNPPPRVIKDGEEAFALMLELKNGAEQAPLPYGYAMPSRSDTPLYQWRGGLILAAVLLFCGILGMRKYTRHVTTVEHDALLSGAKERFLSARAQYETDPHNREFVREAYAATRAYICACAGIADIPGFTAAKLMNEGGKTAKMYARRLAEKEGLYDAGTREKLAALAARNDLSFSVPREAAVFLADIEHAYFAQGGTP